LFSHKSNPTDQQALINNSLVTRFDKTEEKYAIPTGFFELTSGQVSFPNVSATSEILYYVSKNGEIRSVSIKNQNTGTTLVAKIQPNASYLSWGTNKTLIASSPAGSIFYDLASNYSKKYDAQIKNPVLNKMGDKIAYTYFNE
jgi:lipoprotein-anchoring transpeptidase ErfK/SrfK